MNTALKRRRLPKPARKAISANGKSVSSIRRFALCTRAVFATCVGRAAKILLEQPAQMARANPKMLRQRFDPFPIKRALVDQP